MSQNRDMGHPVLVVLPTKCVILSTPLRFGRDDGFFGAQVWSEQIQKSKAATKAAFDSMLG
jgi:hypothetical protein